MIQKSFCRTVIVLFLSTCLVIPSQADTLKSDVRNIEIGIVVVAAAVVVVAVLVVRHERRQTITGCVHSGANGNTITDEKNQRVYALSGNTVGIAAGKRLKLQGKELKSQGPESVRGWRATKIAGDLGACRI